MRRDGMKITSYMYKNIHLLLKIGSQIQQVDTHFSDSFILFGHLLKMSGFYRSNTIIIWTYNLSTMPWFFV